MARLENSEVLANHSHIAFVAVPKRLPVSAPFDAIGNETSDKTSLLNGCLSHSRDRLSALRHRGHIARDKDVWRLGNVHEGVNKCASGPVRLCS